jgi:hypothetical protein
VRLGAVVLGAYVGTTDEDEPVDATQDVIVC